VFPAACHSEERNQASHRASPGRRRRISLNQGVSFFNKLWIPAFAGVAGFGVFYTVIEITVPGKEICPDITADMLYTPLINFHR